MYKIYSRTSNYRAFLGGNHVLILRHACCHCHSFTTDGTSASFPSTSLQRRLAPSSTSASTTPTLNSTARQWAHPSSWNLQRYEQLTAETEQHISSDHHGSYKYFVDDGIGPFTDSEHADTFLAHINPDLQCTIEHPSSSGTFPISTS